jgi:CheY-like chemotaxis protein
VGQLTGGIAHDFNNLLTVILGSAEILVEEVRDEHHELAHTILHAAERGADLTRRLLAFARRQVLEPRPTRISDLLEEMEPLLRRSLGEQIALTVYPSPADIWPAQVDPGQLETAILNLALNARDAMPQGGKLVVETENFQVPNGDPSLVHDLEPGDYVALAVSDTGSGMTPATIAQAFEPFFTTKDHSKGTGLGLSMVYGFVKQSKGHVKIYSELGRGTTVRMFLPRAVDVAATAPDQDSGALPRGNELILLVEDDLLVRNSTKQHLAALGYRVLTAESGAAALQMVAAQGPPDLLLTDIVMPGNLDGFELAARLRRRWPTLKVLFTSGYAHGAITAQHDIEGYFIGKPFRRAELAVKLRQSLESGSSKLWAPL